MDDDNPGGDEEWDHLPSFALKQGNSEKQVSGIASGAQQTQLSPSSVVQQENPPPASGQVPFAAFAQLYSNVSPMYQHY